MKTLTVPFLNLPQDAEDVTTFQPINNEPWAENTESSCKAAFAISHFNQGICLTYHVTEAFLFAKKRKINSDVHLDNCVEFFIAFDEETEYYNFEFNCLGSIKGAFGKGRENRVPLPQERLSEVIEKMEISIDNTHQDRQIRWRLSVILPVDIFIYHQKTMLAGLNCSANFTKCGDSLPNPHFLSWVVLKTATPDFHQPSSFGILLFEKPYETV